MSISTYQNAQILDNTQLLKSPIWKNSNIVRKQQNWTHVEEIHGYEFPRGYINDEVGL